MTRSLPVRARVTPGADSRTERLFDPLVNDVVRRGPLFTRRFATHWGDTAALEGLAARKRSALPADLARELLELHRRLGASPASLAHLDLLARGEAVCAIAGQQPAPLGGPLYAFHKIAASIGLASRFSERCGSPCVPVFWMHGEDSDFEEIRSATIADSTLTLRDYSLAADAHADGGLVGAVALPPLVSIEREALAAWSARPATSEAAALLERSRAGARDLGEAYAALALALFAEQGLVVIDPRLPSFRAAARPVIDRYLARADELSAAVRRAGEELEANGGRRALADATLDSFVFRVENGTRHKVSPAEARSAATLAPSVALRPAVQDGVLPTIAMACGPGELAYLAQLKEVFAGVQVEPACAVPRFGATWLPPSAIELLEASGADPWDLVVSADAVLRRHAESAIPKAAQSAFDEAHRTSLDALSRFSAEAASVDASLPQLVDSARAKVDFQFQRLAEGLAGKARQKLERRHPEWSRLRYYLSPGDRLQERRLAGLELVAFRGAGVARDLAELAAHHARRLEEGTHEHALVDLA